MDPVHREVYRPVRHRGAQAARIKGFSDPSVEMPEERDNWHFLWMWTWVFVAVSSAGYAIVNLISSGPGGASGGVITFFLEVGLPIGMCAAAIWLGLDEWRKLKDKA